MHLVGEAVGEAVVELQQAVVAFRSKVEQGAMGRSVCSLRGKKGAFALKVKI